MATPTSFLLQRSASDPSVRSARRPRPSVVPGSLAQKALLACSAVGPLLFIGVYTVEGLARPDYSPVQQTISALSLGPDGWVQVANFIVFGLLTAISALGWRAALAPGRGAVAVPVVRLLMGLGLIVAGVFSMDPQTAGMPTQSGLVHNLASYVALGGTWVSAFLLAARFVKEPGWRWWGAGALVSGLASIALLGALGVATSHQVDAGLFERLASAATIPLTFGVAVRLIAGSGRVSL